MNKPAGMRNQQMTVHTAALNHSAQNRVAQNHARQIAGQHARNTQAVAWQHQQHAAKTVAWQRQQHAANVSTRQQPRLVHQSARPHQAAQATAWKQRSSPRPAALRQSFGAPRPSRRTFAAPQGQRLFTPQRQRTFTPQRQQPRMSRPASMQRSNPPAFRQRTFNPVRTQHVNAPRQMQPAMHSQPHNQRPAGNGHNDNNNDKDHQHG
jgi:hypothetical protein